MKRAVVLLALLCLLIPVLSARGVDLEQGWYAWFGSVCLKGNEPGTGVPYSAIWYPTSSLGQSGYLTVSEWEGYPSTRKVTVSVQASVSPGTLFEDAGSYWDAGHAYHSVYAAWGTDYDSTRMRLQLFRRRSGQADELVWQQVASGSQQGDGGNIWSSSPVLPGDQLVFRVVAIPEPTSLMSLAWGVGVLLWRSRSRKG